MKKLPLLFFLLCTFFRVFAQGTEKLNDYTGVFVIENGPIEQITLGIEDGRLYGKSTHGEAALSPTTKADSFIVEGYNGTLNFVRGKGIITGFRLELPEVALDAKRLMPPLTDFVGTYIFENAPVHEINLLVDDNGLAYNVEGMDNGTLTPTSQMDKFYGSEPGSTVVFQRNQNGEVTQLTASVNGSDYTAKREKPISLESYKGTYEFDAAPFSRLIISVEKEMLHGNALGQGEADLTPTTTPDAFEIPDYHGQAVFNRDDSGEIAGVTLYIQGNKLIGKKQ